MHKIQGEMLSLFLSILRYHCFMLATELLNLKSCETFKVIIVCLYKKVEITENKNKVSCKITIC